MNKIEQIEKLIAKWKADGKTAYEDGDISYEKLCIDRAIGLESALVILKQPSNKVDVTDTKPCQIKHDVYKNLSDLKECPVCGKALS